MWLSTKTEMTEIENIYELFFGLCNDAIKMMMPNWHLS